MRDFCSLITLMELYSSYETYPNLIHKYANMYTLSCEARQQLHKNVASNIEQVLAATPHKAPTIRPPASHHENYPKSSYTRKTCKTLLEQQGRVHKWSTLMDSYILAEQKQDDMLERTYSSYVRIRDVALKTC